MCLSRVAVALILASVPMVWCSHVRAGHGGGHPRIAGQLEDFFRKKPGRSRERGKGFITVTASDPIFPPDVNLAGGSALYNVDGSPDNVTYLIDPFTEDGTYYLYVRYSMFGDIQANTYDDNDSILLPDDFGSEQDADLNFSPHDFDKMDHNDRREIPPYWEGKFHWENVGQYEVLEQYVADGRRLEFTIVGKDRGVALDAYTFNTSDDLTEEQLDSIFGLNDLQAGDADQNLDFNSFDLIQVQIAAKYNTGQSTTWGKGDWNGAPGGSPGNPPPGDGLFNQIDIIAALRAGKYLTGPYAAVAADVRQNDGQTSIVYDPITGELAVEAPAGSELTSINIDSSSGIFTGEVAKNLGGSFDHDDDNNIFKATFGSSFASLSFGNVAQPGLQEGFLLNDLSVVGSLQGGRGLGEVDLVYVAEPSSLVLGGLALLGFVARIIPTKVKRVSPRSGKDHVK